ncbi:MAG: hypothetical protein K6E27_14375 [Eubacterium sp.]|nr:hypothetical protein [Eubacterium sp.]
MKKKGEYNPDDIGGLYGTAIAFGVINLVLVGICFLIKLAVVSAGLALFFLLAFYAVFLEVKDGIKEKNMKGLGKGLLGLAINVAALILYFYNLKIKYFGS